MKALVTLALALALAFALALATPASADHPGTPLDPFHGSGGKTLVWFGDSNSTNAEVNFALRYADEFYYSTNIANGTTLAYWINDWTTAAAGDYDALMLALVTNDANPGRGGGLWILSLWEHAFQQAADDCVVVVKPYLGKTSLDRRYQFWQHLKQIMDRYSNVREYDWNAEVQRHRWWLLADDVHYNWYGNSAYSDALARAARLCTG